MTTKIDGIALPATLGASLGGTPEEAAKAFLAAASAGMAQVLRDAVVAAVGEAVGGAAKPDWANYITGLVCDMQWSVPPGTMPTTLITFAGTGAALGGGEVTVGVKWTF